MTEVQPDATLEQLQKLEQVISRTLPDQYKAFLLRTNGGRPVPAYFRTQWHGQEWAKGWEVDQVDFFLSVNDSGSSDFLGDYETYKGRIPNDTVSIAYDPGGNLVLLGVGERNYGKVFVWMQGYETEEADYSNVGLVANSFNEFLDSLYDGE